MKPVRAARTIVAEGAVRDDPRKWLNWLDIIGRRIHAPDPANGMHQLPAVASEAEDLMHQNVIDISPGTERFCWLRFGPCFAAEFFRRRVEQMRPLPR